MDNFQAAMLGVCGTVALFCVFGVGYVAGAIEGESSSVTKMRQEAVANGVGSFVTDGDNVTFQWKAVDE